MSRRVIYKKIIQSYGIIKGIFELQFNKQIGAISKFCYIILLLSIEEMSIRHIRSLFILFLLLSLTNNQVQYLQFQIDPVIVSRANFYLNVLNTQVQTYNWVFCNKPLLYTTVVNTLVWLRMIRNSMPCGNVIDGSNNAVSGVNNVVVGNKNKVNGVNNWVFVSNYKASSASKAFTDSILAIGNYQIDLTKIENILTNSSSVISMIDSDGYNNLCSKNVATSFFFAS